MILALVAGIAAGGFWYATRGDDGAGDRAETLARQRAEVDAVEQRVTALDRRSQALRARVQELKRKQAAAAARADARATSAAAASPTPTESTARVASGPEGVSGDFGAVFGPATPSGRATSAGSLTTGPAWSTIKVPMAIALERSAPGSRPADVSAAITVSDNDAARRIWDALGTPAAAGTATQAVLADGGDTATRVQTAVVRPPFSAYGQTSWSLTAQQRFARSLPCLRGAESVTSLMGRIDPSQRWGLGAAGHPAAFKGGWGPDPSGRYLVRQFGLLELPSGTVAVAIAVAPADGAFGTGTAELSTVARWVASVARGSGPAGC